MKKTLAAILAGVVVGFVLAAIGMQENQNRAQENQIHANAKLFNYIDWQKVQRDYPELQAELRTIVDKGKADIGETHTQAEIDTITERCGRDTSVARIRWLKAVQEGKK